MDFVQTNTSTDALVTAIRANLGEFYRHLGRKYPESSVTTSKFTRWYTSVQHPWFRGVLSSSEPESRDETFIEESIEYFRSKGAPACTWWFEPTIKPSAWEPVLSQYGFVFSNDTPGMAADLRELNKVAPTAGGLEVRLVTDEETLRTWAHVFTVGYGLPPAWEPDVYALQKRLGLGYPMRNYLGYLKDQAVSASSLFCGAGVAGIYSVATLPEARGKGIGAAMTSKPLRDAHDMGFHIGVLQSSDMGFNVYRKMGFKHLCQIEYFYKSIG